MENTILGNLGIFLFILVIFIGFYWFFTKPTVSAIHQENGIGGVKFERTTLILTFTGTAEQLSKLMREINNGKLKIGYPGYNVTTPEVNISNDALYTYLQVEGYHREITIQNNLGQTYIARPSITIPRGEEPETRYFPNISIPNGTYNYLLV